MSDDRRTEGVKITHYILMAAKSSSFLYKTEYIMSKTSPNSNGFMFLSHTMHLPFVTINVYSYLYRYIHTHTHTHTYIYIYIYIYNLKTATIDLCASNFR